MRNFFYLFPAKNIIPRAPAPRESAAALTNASEHSLRVASLGSNHQGKQATGTGIGVRSASYQRSHRLRVATIGSGMQSTPAIVVAEHDGGLLRGLCGLHGVDGRRR